MAALLIFGCINAGTIVPALTGFVFGKNPNNANEVLLSRPVYVAGQTNFPVCTYFGYQVTSMKLNGAEVPITSVNYPDITGVTSIQICPNGRRAILICDDAPIAGGGSLNLFKQDISQYTGTNTIAITISTSGARTGSRADSPLGIWLPYACSDSSSVYVNGGEVIGGVVSYTFTNQGQPQPTCPNGICESGETVQTCPQDCTISPRCGDGICNDGETSVSCQQDCPPTVSCNNNGVCDSGETISSCPNDCKTVPTTTCSDGTQPGYCSVQSSGMRCSASLNLVQDSTCVSSTSCSDGTASGSCSKVSVGKKCVSGQLVSDSSCNVQKDFLTQIGEFVMGVINGILRFFGLAH